MMRARQSVHRTILTFVPLLLVSIPLAALAYQVGKRIVFPWDLYLWCESPFLTNLIKISRGQPIYTTPQDANSFVYSPGLEYLTYALLRPFQLQLDIRFARVVTVLIGLGASVLAAVTGGLLLSRLATGGVRRHAYLPFAGITTALVLFKNFTADVCHPDNLHAFHVTATFLLCILAVFRDEYRIALAAVVFAATGVLGKQTAALEFVGATAALLIVQYQRWSWARCMLLVVTAVGAFSVSLGAIFSQQYGRLYTLDLLTAQGVHLAKLTHLLLVDVLQTPFRLLLVLACPLAVYYLARTSAGRAYITHWLLIGVTAVLPTLLAYMKEMGLWNNLMIIDVWMSLTVVPALYHLTTEGNARVRAGAHVVFVVLVVTLFPTKKPPTDAHYAYGRDLEERIGRDIRAGKRVLLAHGTMPLVRNGVTEPPLDRANSVLELKKAGCEAMGGTAARVDARLYDVIYLNSDWYGPLVINAIEANYHEVDHLQCNLARGTPRLTLASGYQDFSLMQYIRIMKPNAAPRALLELGD